MATFPKTEGVNQSVIPRGLRAEVLGNGGGRDLSLFLRKSMMTEVSVKTPGAAMIPSLCHFPKYPIGKSRENLFSSPVVRRHLP